MLRYATSIFAAALLSACATQPPTAAALIPSVTLTLNCPVDARAPRAAYVGPYRGLEGAIPLQDLAQDIHCADAYRHKRFPRGYVTIYGSSRIKPCEAQACTDPINSANHALYQEVHSFAKAWTERYGSRFPIMTGAGRGLMEAGNKGAYDAGGPSIGYTTYYEPAPAPTTGRPYTENPSKALNEFVTEGLVFSSVATRETAMIKHSAAVVLAPGGTGTEWEIFQILEMIKSKQLSKVGVYTFGNPQHWESFEKRLEDLYARGVVRKDELAFRTHARTVEELIDRLSADLALVN